MDTKQKKKLKTQIIAQLDDIETSVKNLKLATKPIAPDNAIGRISRMEAINAKSVNEKALANAKARKAGLEQALTKIDDPNFGRCVICDEDIPLGRLMLMPGAETCVRCAETA